MAKLKYQRKDVKKWAKESYKGLENCLMPSYKKDLSGLDEEGIRNDVQQSIKHGFCKTCIVVDAGTTTPELKRMTEIIVDEADGKILVSLWLGLNNTETMLEMLRFGEEVGIDSALMHYPTNSETFNNEEDIFKYTKKICDSTNLAIDLYPSHKYNFERFHPSTFSPKLTARLAEIENVAGMKEGSPDINSLVETFKYTKGNLLPQTPVVGFWSTFVTAFGMQWAGAAPFEFFQDTENRQLVTYFQLLKEGRLEDAQRIYWRLSPVLFVFNNMILPTVQPGLYNYNMWKYAQWLVGGSGGYIRVPCMKLFEHDKVAIKNAMRAAGINIRAD